MLIIMYHYQASDQYLIDDYRSQSWPRDKYQSTSQLCFDSWILSNFKLLAVNRHSSLRTLECTNSFSVHGGKTDFELASGFCTVKFETPHFFKRLSLTFHTYSRCRPSILCSVTNGTDVVVLRSSATYSFPRFFSFWQFFRRSLKRWKCTSI